MASARSSLPVSIGAIPAIALMLSLAISAPMETAQASIMTQGYVVHMLHPATYSHPDNCPRGGSGNEPEIQRRLLRSLGYSPAEIQKIMQEDIGKRRKLVAQRGRDANGNPVNAIAFPTSVADPHIELVSGPYAYGFDLDGKGVGTAGSFTDPQTRQGGVDNQLFRAIGCFAAFDMTLPVRPQAAEAHWNLLLENMPAWVFAVSGKDLTQDGDVTVTFYRATNHPARDALGRVQADATYVIEPAGRTRGQFKGRIHEGLLTVDPADISIEGDLPVAYQLDLKQAQLRLDMRQPDRTVAGWLGGYLKWLDYYFEATVTPGSYVDEAGLYYALRRLADAEPDPQTGQNQRISATYRIEATPVFLARPDGQLLEGVAARP